MTTTGKKRTYGEITRESVYSRTFKGRNNYDTYKKRKLCRNDRMSPKRRRGDSTDSLAEESGMEDDQGGSSQDKLESDFIDDECREEIDAKKAR